VGGIPELISADCLVRPDDEAGLAEKIREVLSERSRLNRMSAENLARASGYSEDILRQRREVFYRRLASETLKHMPHPGAAAKLIEPSCSGE
jgi:L-malate glycosyltransferase